MSAARAFCYPEVTMPGYQCESCRGRQPKVHIEARVDDYRAAPRDIGAKALRPDEDAEPDHAADDGPAPRGKRRRRTT